ncbi:hypothetical protein P154DRAFT_569890 [Amniculicola lignicola CBS 123094]|uniref:Lytic polysaccharide monooxygenase n=1 Tax=Amniculicola lignicola CBS 123094 TaxID=1392246 RepID=A0A6A5WXN6_9PLEO|nr:hypothetical protein P154DRAFT_569890 [Amniculicola lignicola CBS 123094]
MKAGLVSLFALYGTSTALGLNWRRFEDDDEDHHEADDHGHGGWRPKTKYPHFFQIQVDDKCGWHEWSEDEGDHNDDHSIGGHQGSQGGKSLLSADGPEEPGDGGGIAKRQAKGHGGHDGHDGHDEHGWNWHCPFENYVLRLYGGKALVVPWNKWKDDPAPTFFVDDDSQAYTVSRKPLQLYIDRTNGQLRYSKAGWLPPQAISIGFFQQGDNPQRWVDPSPAYFSWPSTKGNSPGGHLDEDDTDGDLPGTWLLCPIAPVLAHSGHPDWGYVSSTGEYQVFINPDNFPFADPVTTTNCRTEDLAALNANPWKKKKGGHGGDWTDHEGGEWED